MKKETPEYQVFARKYRPQLFKDVIGQEAVVLTIKRAIASSRLGHAYLFAGPHGTGKTSIARLFAKAINCKNFQEEPCNECSSCKEITGGYSLDVLEIDGASHRGIEDIRQLNETIGYTTSGNYKIYLIDEVHMLTKEAFNALLKSLEEPPPHVKFFFATTEPHLIPLTILSRCQRFNFRPISQENIVEKLKFIGNELKLDIEVEALYLLASLAEGGMRDAESLFDELVAFQKGKITKESVETLFGLPEKVLFSTLDDAAKTSDFNKAFEIVNDVFSSGKNISFFLEGLTKHFRALFLSSLKEKNPTYSKENLLEILEMLVEAEQEFKSTISKKTFLEVLLMRILQMPKKLSLNALVDRLEELEKRLEGNNEEKPIEKLVQKPLEKPMEKSVEKPMTDQKPLPIKSRVEEKGETKIEKNDKSRFDTLMRFAAKELNGSLKI